MKIRAGYDPAQGTEIDPDVGVIEKHLKAQNSGIDQQRLIAKTQAQQGNELDEISQ